MSPENFSLTTRIARPAEEVFAWHERPGALARLTPPWERVQIVTSAGGVGDGSRAVIRSAVGPFWSEWEAEHRDRVAGRQFRDVMIRGPFASWEHLHAIEPEGPGACRLTDTISYRLPLGVAGRWLAGGWVRRKIERAFRWRHAVTKADLESAARLGPVAPMNILVAGGSGLLGQALIPFLRTQGHRVVVLVRRRASGADELSWIPAGGTLDATALGEMDAAVNLSGENIAGGRWTAGRRARIRSSRVDATRTLVSALARAEPRPRVLVNASAVGVYGDHGAEVLDESSPEATGFLPEVVHAWETEAERLRDAGGRVALLRFGVVLSPAGGALGKMLPAFRLGLAGRLGSGRQWLSWVSADDAVAAVYHALTDAKVAGPVNVVAPGAVTNAEFTGVLARVLQRPAVIPIPVMVLHGLFGEMADAALLASTRASAAKLEAAGYVFRFPCLEPALRHVLGIPS